MVKRCPLSWRTCRFTRSDSFLLDSWVVLSAYFDSMGMAQNLIMYHWNIIYFLFRRALLCTPGIEATLVSVQLSLIIHGGQAFLIQAIVLNPQPSPPNTLSV